MRGPQMPTQRANVRIQRVPSMQQVKPIILAAILTVAIGIAAKDARAEDIVLKDAASMTGAVTWLSSGAPGLVLAVVRGDESLVLGFGETRPGNKVEPDGRS